MSDLICTTQGCSRKGKIQGTSSQEMCWDCSECWTRYNAELLQLPPDETAESLAKLRGSLSFEEFRDAYCDRKEAEHAKAEGIPVEAMQARVEATAAMLRERK